MTIDEQIDAALQLMILGMGSVFIILGLLIMLMTLMARLFPSTNMNQETESAQALQEIAAIQAAIHIFRRARSGTRI